MVDFNFYGVNATIQVNQNIFKLLVSLLQKTQASKSNSLIFSNSIALLTELDNFLWTNADWLPHALNSDKYREQQPILLTNELINHNNSKYMFIIDSSDFEILPELEKISIIFNFNDNEALVFFKEKWDSLKEAKYNLKYFKQDHMGKFKNETP